MGAALSAQYAAGFPLVGVVFGVTFQRSRFCLVPGLEFANLKDTGRPGL